MKDEMVERELQTWFELHTEPDVPKALRQFLLELPKTQSAILPVIARSPIAFGAPRRDLALVLVAAAVAVTVGAGLIAGFGLLKTVAPSSSPAVTAESSPTASAAPPSPAPSLPLAAGLYWWRLVSSTGDLAAYGVGPVIRRANGSLLAVAHGEEARVLTSPDGSTWTLEPADPGLLAASSNHISIVADVAEGPAGLVAVGATALDDISSGDARAWTSVDGLTWQAAPTAAGMVDAEMESVVAGRDGFVAVGSDGFPGGNTQLPGARGAAVWLSRDGRTWTRVPNQASFAGGVMFGVRRTSSGYVAWGEIHDPGGSTTPLPPIWTSADGLHWDRAAGIADAGGPGNPIASIAVLGDRLVAVGSRQLPESAEGISVPAVWVSTDHGRNWTLAASPDELASTPTAGGLRDLSVSGSELLAVGYREVQPSEVGAGPALLWRSTDGAATWTALPDDPSFAGAIIQHVIGIDGGFVAFGSADDPNALSNPKLIWLGERSSAGGTCPADQFVVGTPVDDGPGFPTFGWADDFVRVPLRNVGPECLLDLPATIGVATGTGQFQVANVLNSGIATAFSATAGGNVDIVLGDSWPIPSRSGAGTPRPCPGAINDVSRIEFPFASGSLQIDLPALWPEVCPEPASVSMTFITK